MESSAQEGACILEVCACRRPACNCFWWSWLAGQARSPPESEGPMQSIKNMQYAARFFGHWTHREYVVSAGLATAVHMNVGPSAAVPSDMAVQVRIALLQPALPTPELIAAQ